MENLQDERDRQLWKEAKKRVSFRNHLFSYLIVNAFFWAMWYSNGRENDEGGVPWPTFCSLGWGFGLFWHFMGAFVFNSKSSQIEKEFQKLKNKTS
jgi:hypothetical protein